MADEALSVEQAVAELQAAREPAPPVEAEQPQPEPEASDVPPEAELASEAQEPGDGEQPDAEEPAQPDVKAPTWWSKEKQAEFSRLPPELQATIAEQEGTREQQKAKAVEEAAAARKAAEESAQTYQGVIAALDQAVPQWVTQFRSEWEDAIKGGPSYWAQLSQEYPAEQVQQWRFQFEAKQAALAGAIQAQEDAKRLDDANFWRTRSEQLPVMAPELADPVEGEKRQTELSQWLLKAGANPERVKRMDALEMSMAYDAMRFRNAQTSLARKPAPQPARPTAPPSAAPARSSQQRSLDQLNARLNKTGSVDDAVRLLQARRKG